MSTDLSAASYIINNKILCVCVYNCNVKTEKCTDRLPTRMGCSLLFYHMGSVVLAFLYHREQLHILLTSLLTPDLRNSHPSPDAHARLKVSLNVTFPFPHMNTDHIHHRIWLLNVQMWGRDWDPSHCSSLASQTRALSSASFGDKCIFKYKCN